MLALEAFVARLTTADLLALLLGVVLLFLGRRLYWLALGGAGFFVGLQLAERLLDLRDTGFELGLAFLGGIVGAVLAVAVQKLAVGLAGMFLGGFGGYHLVLWLEAALAWHAGPWLWILAAAGAVVGVVFASAVFEVALIALSALVGAALVASRLPLPYPEVGWLFLGLLLLGTIVQAWGEGKRRRRD
jgi:hypothetical protein